MSAFPALVLFDLDGTLLDSAPDMVATINQMRARRGLSALALEEVRPHVSRGARAMVGAAFPDWSEAAVIAAVPEFLEIYGTVLGQYGAAFDGVEKLLSTLEVAGSRWGIITNKPIRFAQALMPHLGWEKRSAILLGGDSLPERKPHPLPLLHACDTLGFAPADAVYIGDDRRDIEAAHAAGMPAIAALWGYRRSNDDPLAWGADRNIDAIDALLDARNWP